MKKPKQSIVFHKQAQVIVTGKSVDPSRVKEIRSFSKEKDLHLSNWCSEEGTIGHIDSFTSEISLQEFQIKFSHLANKFNFLDMGISIMSGPPGTFTRPIICFSIKDGILRNMMEQNVHFLHPAPRRIKN